MALVTTAEVCDANPQLIVSGELRALQPVFQIYGRRQVFSGPVVTLKVFEDNVLIREFLEEKVQAQNNGWAGIVVNGCVRDVDEINGCDIGVRALASHPVKANKKGIGEKHVPITIAGTRISDGEWLYADTDGLHWYYSFAAISVFYYIESLGFDQSLYYFCSEINNVCGAIKLTGHITSLFVFVFVLFPIMALFAYRYRTSYEDNGGCKCTKIFYGNTELDRLGSHSMEIEEKDGTTSNNKGGNELRFVQFEIPDMNISLLQSKNAPHSHIECSHIFSEIPEAEFTMEPLNSELMLHDLHEIERSVYSVVDMSVEYSCEQKANLLEDADSVQGEFGEDECESKYSVLLENVWEIDALCMTMLAMMSSDSGKLIFDFILSEGRGSIPADKSVHTNLHVRCFMHTNDSAAANATPAQQNWNVKMHQVQLSDNILVLIDYLWRDFLALLENDKELIQMRNRFQASNDLTLLHLPNDS
ncbi:UNVERIFIED_CONTAM: putative 4-hydroxy-4-methyl-2-oxoglutarate aldolase 2 [Sesamum calycinum]|uniref:4-hydroxy-4-methyl-2-oxoglutarate aldolase 2 n=1 Tax=Sesamum calycinum TaxID=2727403 RepID=A0AAW2QWD7_9LAMI